jgi:anti-sigma factor RsiW
MMAEHLSQIQLTGYSGRALDDDELLAVDRHLASCDVCHEKLARISSPVAGRPSHPTRFTGEPFHLDYDEHLEPYVEGKSNDIDREIVESHIAFCSTCADELSDLQEFRRQPEYVTEHAVLPSKWKRWVNSWRQPAVRIPHFATALVFAVFILAITVAVLLWTTNRASRTVEQANTAAPADQIVVQPSPENQPDRPDQPTEQPEEPLIALNDGGSQVTLDQRGQVEGLGSLSPDLRQAVERALTTRRLHSTKALADLSVAGRLRDEVKEQDTFLPLAPFGTVIESDRPTFRWRKVEDGHVYSVTIYDSRLRNVENSGPLEGTEWTPSTPLKRGVTYTWQIRAVKDGTTIISPTPPAPEARFRVLDRAALTTLGNVKRLHGKSHLTMGIFYWKHGLIDEAEREFEALVSANRQSRVATQLLASLRSLRQR